MTPAEAVVMDWLLDRDYTREQAARALVALTLPEPEVLTNYSTGWLGGDSDGHSAKWAALDLQVEAARRGYLAQGEPHE